MDGSSPTATRRAFLRGAGAAGFLLLAGCSQPLALPRQTPKPRRLGYLSGRSLAEDAPLLDGFRQGMHDLGYDEGREYTLESRFADGQVERSPDLAAELIRLPVDAIVTGGTATPRAARNASSTVPIVLAWSDDAVKFGLVDSLARPGANVTGLTTITTQLNGKRLELLKATLPAAARIAVLWNPAIAERASEFPDVEAAARGMGLQVISLEARAANELDAAFDAARRERADMLLTLDNALINVNRGRIAALAEEGRLPMMSAAPEAAVAGGCMAYGANLLAQFRQAAAVVDKVLRGIAPSDIPLEQPTKFDFVINLKTAQAIGLAVPLSVLQQATSIIQ